MKSYEYYDKISNEYDSMYEDVYWKLHNKLIREVIMEKVLNLEGEKALDIGCGTGIWTNLLKDIGFDVYAIDPSENMVNITQKRLKKNKNIKVGFIENIEFEETFDVILAIGDILSYAKDPLKGIEEVRKHLNKDGLFIGTVDNLTRFIQDAFIQKEFNLMKKMKREKSVQIGLSQKMSFDSKLYTVNELESTLNAFFNEVELKGIMVFPFENDVEMYKYSYEIYELEKVFMNDKNHINNAEHLMFICKK
ncbi:SAM-dependent methyltransferase [Tepiditoga spiralis]|uniref:SAM-dependent methyltransferase n=1 Tax=Tepiditoga spiralis TaxID=2108365 RepID=A0A7G1G9R8_9BACT|nr:class I SAM-dependent methyltransferase [Tepiditoga spiralis]BBE30832.1 SAM-dependent methyltransferase [Tepiditoga spiralis]